MRRPRRWCRPAVRRRWRDAPDSSPRQWRDDVARRRPRSPRGPRRRLLPARGGGTECASRSHRLRAFLFSDVLIQVAPIEVDGAAQSVCERHRRAPSRRALELARVGVEAAYVDRLLVGWPVDVLDGSRAGDAEQDPDELPVADRAIAADVEHFAVARIARPGAKKRVGDVVYVHEVAQLGAVAVDLDRLVLDREPDEPRDEPLATVFDQLPRAVDVRQAKRARAHAEDVVVQKVVVLARGFVDAVDVRWPDEVRLGDGQ